MVTSGTVNDGSGEGNSKRTASSKPENTPNKPENTLNNQGSTSDNQGNAPHKPGSTSDNQGNASHKPGSTSDNQGIASHKPGRTSDSQGIASHKPGRTSDSQENTITIRVSDQTGEQTYFKVKKTTRVEKIIAAYATRKGVNASALRFLLDGQRLNGASAVGDYNLMELDQIDCMLEQQGGDNCQ